jgi:hypothetical protein
VATSEAEVFGRIREVMKDLDFTEATWDDFSKTPMGDADECFVVRFETGVPRGQIGRFEEVEAIVDIAWQRLTNADQAATWGQFLSDKRSILTALITDGQAGQYVVEDGGQALDIKWPPGAGVGRAALRVHINFESAL